MSIRATSRLCENTPLRASRRAEARGRGHGAKSVPAAVLRGRSPRNRLRSSSPLRAVTAPSNGLWVVPTRGGCLAIAEPHAAFACAFARVVALNIGYPIDDLEAGHVDLLEDDPAASQVRHHRPYVLDLEPHLGERAGSRSRREEDVELSGRAKVAQTPLALLDGR